MTNIIKKVSNYFNKTEEIMPLVIVDVGCRWGFADKFIVENDDVEMKIYGFDPDAEECKRLENIYSEQKNITLVPVGLAEELEEKVLYLTKEPACSSLYKPNTRLTQKYPALDCAKEVEQITVNVSTLDIWAKEEKLNYIDYIKIDTQGAELSILKGGENILSTMRFLEIEVEFNPIYDGQPVFSDVDHYLRKHGFVLWRFSNLVHYSQNEESNIILGTDTINYDQHRLEHELRGGQLYWADAFYIKKDIVDTKYDKDSQSEIVRDAKIAKMLGFLDLEDRLLKKMEQ